MVQLDEILSTYLSAQDPLTRARGRVYFEEGRVELYAEEEHSVRAHVRGKDTYDTSFYVDEAGLLGPSCTCPAWKREHTCKHLAAVAWAFSRARRAPPPGPARRTRRERARLPASLALISSAHAFFGRLSLYEGRRLEGTIGRWGSLASWWQHPYGTADVDVEELERIVIEHRDAIEAVSRALVQWSPPSPSRPAGPSFTPFDALEARLAELYVAARAHVELRTLPGPLDERHPGWTFTFDAKTRMLRAEERASPLLESPLHLTVRIPHEPEAPLIVPSWLVREGDCDAWALFALRAMIIALDEESDEHIRTLAAELRRPLWEIALARIAEATAKPRADTYEWGFALAELYSSAYLSLTVYARKAGKSRATTWKRMAFEVLLESSASPLELEIARVASTTLDSRTRSPLPLASAQGHALAKLLADHPRVVFHGEDRPDFERGQPARIFAGDLTMRLEPDDTGAVRPVLALGEVALPIPLASLVTEEEPRFLAGSRVAADGVREIVSVRIPSALREWVAVTLDMGEHLAFPADAIVRLAEATKTLTQTGIVRLPRSAMGIQLSYDPQPALRVEWKGQGAALVELMLSPSPRAPLIAPGVGEQVFSFEDEGRAVWVERNLDVERALVERFVKETSAPLAWTSDHAMTRSLEESLALAQWLAANPEGLRIEVKRGAAPKVVHLAQVQGLLTVRRSGGWLMLGGALDVEGVRVSIGDVLEAIRMSEQFMRAGEDVFLELSEELAAKLRPFAHAANLTLPDGRDRTDGEGTALVRVHEAFGAAVYEAASVFSEVSAPGIDLAAYVERFQRSGARLPKNLIEHGELRPYQRDGVLWMLRLAEWAPGCILADDMGLGKTVQTAAVLKARAKLGPALIVAPASVTSNWLAELARFVPSLAVRWFNEEKRAALDDLGARDVVVVSYNLLLRYEGAFEAVHWATAVIDEAQYVKNIFAKRSNAVRSLPRDFTVALTGTPLENHLGELFSIVDLTFPGLLGDERAFRERFRRPIESGKSARRLQALARLLEPFLLRRTRAAVLEELPPREDIIEWIDLSPEEKRRYVAMRDAFAERFAFVRSKKTTPARSRIEILAALLRLRQHACDVRLVDPDWTGPTTKISRCVELATELAAEGNRALVFSAFTQLLEKAHAALEAAGLRVAWLAGETPTNKRRPIIDAFQAGDFDVFCISLQAGGTGLNLTRASYVIHLDPWWNPAVEEQATARSHRMGQTDPVTVYRLISRGTIEEAVLEMQESKRELASVVLEGKADARVIDADELLDLLRYG